MRAHIGSITRSAGALDSLAVVGTSWRRSGLALALLLDGGIHIWAAGAHAMASMPIAGALALAGVVQVGLAAYSARRRGALSYAAAAVSSAGLIVLYALAVTSGLPSPGAHGHASGAHAHHGSAISVPAVTLHREDVGLVGGASKAIELAAVALAVGLIGRRAPSIGRRRTVPAGGLLLAGLGALALAACGAPDRQSAKVTPVQPVAAPPTRAEIKLFAFKPEALRVPVGATVAWTNQDDIEHSVTHGSPEQPGGRFDSGLFAAGGTFDHPFTAAGEYPYFCTRHPHMRAVVQVGGG